MSTTTSASNVSSTAASGLEITTYCRTTVWYTILGSSVCAYLLALITTAVLHFACSHADDSHDKSKQEEERRKIFGKKHRVSGMSRIRLECSALVKGSNSAGKTLLAVYSMAVVTSFIIYVAMTYNFTADTAASKTLLLCHPQQRFNVIYVDLGINIFYTLVFVLRFISSDSKLTFFMSLDTVADHLTIIPSFIMFALGRYMIAFQYARLLGLKYLVNVLIYSRILTSEKHIRLMKLLMKIIITWLASAGFFQLIESIGDFWQADNGTSTANFLDFQVCFYCMLVTMSTVGYGDFSPKTVLGRFFIIMFIIVALGLFASTIPEISQILTESRKYKRNRMHLMHGRRHVVLSGKFDLQTMRTFFEDFYHEGRSENKRHFIAMLGEEEPNAEMKALMKTRELYVTYLQGSLMNLKDLMRAELKFASATIILADGLTQDPEDEDLKNIMRVIAIKDFCPDMRVLVQLHLFRSKTYLRNIPDWSAMHGDQALCINEMKYGVLAQSCVLPGLSTLLGNLLTLRSCKLSNGREDGAWEAEYMRGVEYEFYKVKFATMFQGLTFIQACKLCYEQLGILLLAVQITNWGSGGDWDQVESRQTVINPGSQLTINVATMEAFVIAKDRRDAKRVTRLQITPDEASNKAGGSSRLFSPRHIKQLHGVSNKIHQIPHRKDSDEQPTTSSTSTDSPALLELKTIKDDPLSTSETQPMSDSYLFYEKFKNEQPLSKDHDSSGYFHWVQNRAASSIMLTNHQRYRFRNHIVVCIVERRPDVMLNITSFIMPLRASTIPKEELKDIVFLGNVDLIFNEWSIIQNFPGIYALNGSPLNRVNLKAINIEFAESCIILSPKASSITADAQIDRETVLCTLNIKTMKHPETGRRLGDTIHIVTELNSVGSIEYLDQDDEIEVEEPFMTQAFATGRTFYLSLLGSIATTIFFNEAALNFLRTILTTVDSDNLEVNLNEQGFHFMSSENSLHFINPDLCKPNKSFGGMDPQKRSKMQLFGVSETPLSSLYLMEDRCLWSDLVMRCLERLEIVCIGLFRLQVNKPNAKNHRFVIAMPPLTMEVRPTDKVYCITPPGFQNVTKL